MTIEYEGEVYRDDRMFVLNLSYGRYVKHYGAFSTTIEKKDAWILTTYRNTVDLPITNSNIFRSLEDARTYITKNEHATPLISRKGKPLEIPKKIDGMPDYIPESERPWEFYNRWLADYNLFGAISAGFPEKHKHHCPYWQDKRGYSFKHAITNHNVIVDGVEELFYENGNMRKKTTWVAGLKHGPSTEYYENGQVHMDGFYKEDETHGSYERFHENGQLRSKGQLSEGKQIGYWEWHDEEGNLIKTKDFS